jgi:hypothetical protein
MRGKRSWRRLSRTLFLESCRAPMSNLDVLAFVVWGGGLFNVGFLAGWFAGRRRLRQSDGEAKRFALQGREPVSVLRVAEKRPEGKPTQTEREELPAFRS